ncbi:LIM domain transcription factor LMO4-B [Pelodytes ibericus]
MVNNRTTESTTTAVSNNGSPPKACAGCGGKIADRFLLYSMDRYWHTRCLKCSCCQAQLGEIGTSCYTKSGMILCRNDYIRLFGSSGACSACGQSIPASEMVMRAQGSVYHLKCFTCATCRNRLVPGDRFHYVNGTIFCEHDRPTSLLNGHLNPLQNNPLQSNPMLPDQKVSLLRKRDPFSPPCAFCDYYLGDTSMALCSNTRHADCCLALHQSSRVLYNSHCIDKNDFPVGCEVTKTYKTRILITAQIPSCVLDNDMGSINTCGLDSLSWEEPYASWNDITATVICATAPEEPKAYCSSCYLERVTEFQCHDEKKRY